MAEVSVRGVSKSFGAVRALREVSLDFANGGFFALLGPSGCGKTTLLRLIAGFDFPDSGTIAIGGERVDSTPVEKRNIGMMFQSYALFPNMSVAENVGFGLSVRRVDRAEQRRKVAEALELVRLGDLGDRRPGQLSGGQRQRVALARAIVFEPRVLLLDEPLSALDKALRVGMQIELKRIQREVGVTTIFVTHDQEEALTMSDRIGILRDGALIQEGPPREIYERPATAFAATFLGEANLFNGLTAGDAVTLEGGDAILPSWRPETVEATVAVRPEKMRVAPMAEPVEDGANVIEAVVEQQVFAGASLTTLLNWRGRTLKVFTQNLGGPIPEPGETVRVCWRPEHTVPVRPETAP
jgi:putative spermidine/putrescine transport system ATP-binding protein